MLRIVSRTGVTVITGGAGGGGGPSSAVRYTCSGGLAARIDATSNDCAKATETATAPRRISLLADNHFPAFHYGFHFSNSDVDILQRVAFHGDYIREMARGERPEIVLHAQEIGSVHGGGF